jgi:hypothetical protein
VVVYFGIFLWDFCKQLGLLREVERTPVPGSAPAP